jgi:hypothetical protein
MLLTIMHVRMRQLGPICFYNAKLRNYLMRAPSRYEDPLPMILLKVPGLHPILLLQLLQVVATQEEVLQAENAAADETLPWYSCSIFSASLHKNSPLPLKLPDATSGSGHLQCDTSCTI